MTDWSNTATAGGTLVLAIAAFASVRSSNRAARMAERALQVGVRPVLFASRVHETVQKIRWADGHWASLQSGRAVIEEQDDIIYLAISLQNVGSGIAVLRSWNVALQEAIEPNATVDQMLSGSSAIRPDPAMFRAHSRDMYSPPGDVSFWQAAIRTHDDPDRAVVEAALAGAGPLVVDLLYSDHEGGQRTITRFSVAKYSDGDGGCIPSVIHHWYLDRNDPR
jgi:hypothetical protein